MGSDDMGWRRLIIGLLSTTGVSDTVRYTLSAKLIGYPSAEITFNCADGWTAGLQYATLLCAMFGFLFVRETPVPRRGPLRRRYPMAYQYSNSVYSTQAADNRN